MNGIVKGISSNRQRAAALTDDGYVVFDIEDGEVDIHDRITGCLDDHGHQDLTNQTTGHRLSVCIEAIQATSEAARSLLSRK